MRFRPPRRFKGRGLAPAPTPCHTFIMSLLANPRETAADPIAVYVHIPWCASLCPYCDFDKQAHDFRLVDAYIDALVEHIEATSPRSAHSLYFGGGTPSLLTPARLTRIVDACRARFGLDSAE